MKWPFTLARHIAEYQAKGCRYGDTIQVGCPQRSAPCQGCSTGWGNQGHGNYGNSQRSTKQGESHLRVNTKPFKLIHFFTVKRSILYLFRWESGAHLWCGSVMPFCRCWRRWRNTSTLFTRPWSERVASLLLRETQSHRHKPSKNTSGRSDTNTLNLQ